MGQALSADDVAFALFEEASKREEEGWVLDGLITVLIFSKEETSEESFCVSWNGSTYRAIGALRKAMQHLENDVGRVWTEGDED